MNCPNPSPLSLPGGCRGDPVTTASAQSALNRAETRARARAAPATADVAAVRSVPGPEPLGAKASGQCACGGGCPNCLADAGIAPTLLVGALEDPAERDADRP